MKQIKKEIEKIKKETKEKIIASLLTGFGLVAALAWNEAIQNLFNTFFKKGGGLIGKFVYALLITLLVAALTLQLKKISEEKKE